MGEEPCIRTFQFLKQLGEAYMTVYTHHDLMLDPKNRQKTFQMLFEGFHDLLANDKFWNSKLSPEEREENTQLILAKLEENVRTNIDRYEIWLLNMGLFMFCTVFELYLNHVFELLIADEEKLTLLMEKGDALNASFREQKCKNFEFGGIKKKIGWLERLGVNMERVYKFECTLEEARNRILGTNTQTLIDIFEKRHDVAHSRITGISDLEELLKIKEILEHVMIDIAYVSNDELGVPFDFSEMQKGNYGSLMN